MDVGLGDGGWGGEGSKGHFGQGNGTYRGAGARETRKSLDTGVKGDSQIQKGLISHGPELGLYPEDDGESIHGENREKKKKKRCSLRNTNI